MFITKKKKEANFTVAICKESENKVAIIKDPKDPSQTHKYSYCHRIGNSTHYTYSEQFIEFILIEIKKDPHNFVESLKKV